MDLIEARAATPETWIEEDQRMMDRIERRLLALKLHEDGKTHKEIGSYFGISTGRAATLVRYGRAHVAHKARVAGWLERGLLRRCDNCDDGVCEPHEKICHACTYQGPRREKIKMRENRMKEKIYQAFVARL